jgi:hypothetical protein
VVTVLHFAAVPTDVPAWRVTLDNCRYRDLWRVYAPGSFTVLALPFD